MSVLTRQATEENGAWSQRLSHLLSSAFGVYLNLPQIKSRTAEVLDFWKKDAPITPQLYLYSEADAIVDSKDISRFKAEQVLGGGEGLSLYSGT